MQVIIVTLHFGESVRVARIEITVRRQVDVMRLTLWLPNRSHRWPAIHNGSEAIFLDGHRFVCWQVPTPQFYPNSVRPLNMNLWMPRQERPIVVGQGRNSNRDDSRRRGQPRAVAGSVSADVNRRLGLARGLVVDRIPGVPPRSAAHPWLCTDGLPGRRSAPANSKAFRITVVICGCRKSYDFLNQPAQNARRRARSATFYRPQYAPIGLARQFQNRFADVFSHPRRSDRHCVAEHPPSPKLPSHKSKSHLLVGAEVFGTRKSMLRTPREAGIAAAWYYLFSPSADFRCFVSLVGSQRKKTRHAPRAQNCSCRSTRQSFCTWSMSAEPKKFTRGLFLFVSEMSHRTFFRDSSLTPRQARDGWGLFTLECNSSRGLSASLPTGIHVPPFVDAHFDGDGALAVTALNDQPSGFAIVQNFREHWVRRQVRRGG